MHDEWGLLQGILRQHRAVTALLFPEVAIATLTFHQQHAG